MLEKVDPRTAVLKGLSSTAPEYAAELLRLYKGTHTITTITKLTGLKRLQISRILSGTTQPRLPRFLLLLDALSGRVDEFIGSWVDLDLTPALKQRLAVLTSWRHITYAMPITEGIVACIESKAYQDLHEPTDQWLAHRLGIQESDLQASLAAMTEAHLIREGKTRWEPLPNRSIDTVGSKEGASRVKRYWAQKAAERIENEPGAKGAYLVFCSSEQSVEAIQQIYRKAWTDARTILRNDSGNDRVILLNINWVPLEAATLEETA